MCIAAFLAGGLNSLAGGGSFITLPALLYAGITPVLANTTSAPVSFGKLFKVLLISFLITTVSVSVFLFNGFIVWSYVLYMVLFSVLGGFAGAKLTEILPAKLVRKFIILVGLSLSASLIFIGYIK